MSTGANTWVLNEPFFVASSSNNTDGVPNWVYDVVSRPCCCLTVG